MKTSELPATADDLRPLLDSTTSMQRSLELVAPVGFADAGAAVERLRRIAGTGVESQAFGPCLPMLLLALSDTAQPDQALINFDRFVHAVPDRMELFRELCDNPRTVEILVRLFVGSQFLTEILLCNPGHLGRLSQHKRLAELKSVQQLSIEARGATLGIDEPEDQLNALRRFQRWELLRVGTCDFFGLLDLRRVTTQLSLLADALVRSCLEHAYVDSGVSPQGFVVVAMGKLGGEELNYSSDIDLLFLAESNSPAHWRIGQRLIKALTEVSQAGFMYRVDMRLRPWGQSGELVSSIDGHLAYLQQHAQLWEKQALLKARVIAGDFALGAGFLRRAETHVFNVPAEFVRDSVRRMKQKIEDALHKKGKAWGEVKLGEGSIRDVEFLVQYLQLIHGRSQPAVRSFNTLDALVRLADLGFLHADEYRVLTDGYCFLRTIEHSLQLMHNKQTHELPREESELLYLARRLDFGAGDHFLTHYRKHCEAVRAVYERYLGEHDSIRQQTKPAQNPVLSKHLSRLEREYSATFSEADIERHAALAERVTAETPVIVEAEPIDGLHRVTIVGYDYPSELSLICGLLLAHGFDIVDGQVFTYEPVSAPAEAPRGNVRRAWRRQPYRRIPRRTDPGDSATIAPREDYRQKIVDVFTVRSTKADVTPDVWERYAAELKALLAQLQPGQAPGSPGALVKQVAATLRTAKKDSPRVLYPVEFEINNDVSEQFTVLSISTIDTTGFLYEFTNALALSGVYIARVKVGHDGDRVHDTLYVTDARGQKITDVRKQRELRAATVLIKHFMHLLPQSSNPEAALLHFRDFLAQLFTRPDWADEIASLEKSTVLDALAQLLGVSDFLWNDFLRMQHANLFPVVRDVDALATPRSAHELSAELDERVAAAGDSSARRDVLNDFKDREMFRVDMRHILGQICEFSRFSDELTEVAEVVVATAVRLCFDELKRQYGAPLLDAGGDCRHSVCALGKFGGRELGFASDIELMFLYEGEGRTDGGHSIATTEFFVKLAEQVTHAIRARREGIFEIDLRLRPYGRGGTLAVSLDAFRQYFGPEGAAWPYERQSLVKLRPVAGNVEFGASLVSLRDELIYTGEPFDVSAMRGMRERQLRQLVSPGVFNAKLSPGALVDVEYLVQGLQMTHGNRLPTLRSTNTLKAIEALADAEILTREDAARLRDAYDFFRQLIGSLRIVRGNARDLTIPPDNTDELAFLARRLAYDEASRLKSDIERHVGAVLQISLKMLG